MRTTKELLEVMLEVMLEKPNLLNTGLCNLINALLDNDYLSLYEHEKISLFLEANLPRYRFNTVYCWPVGEKEPRIKWIKEQIEKLHLVQFWDGFT